MLRARKYECSNRFRIYKYIGEHSCGVEHANSSHRKISIKVIVSLSVNMYRDGKGPNVKEIERAMFNSFRCSPSYWKCWKGGVVVKEMVRGTTENRYSCLPAFSYMFETLNVGSSYSIMVNKDNHRFMYYFLAFGACIKGFAHMRKTFFFEKLKEIVVDESNLCFISDRHKSIANAIVNVYNHAHHRYCMSHLGENLCVNHHCEDYFYLYYNAAKAYSLEEFDNHFVEFKNKCPAAAVVLKYDIGFEKWSRAYFPGSRYDVMTTNFAESLNVMLIDERERPPYILKSMGNQMVPSAKKIARRKMIEGHSLYMENVTGDGNQFTVFGAGVTAYVDQLEKSCSFRKYDFIKIPCAHAMAALRSKHGNEYCISIYEYPSPLYKVESFLLAYLDYINVVPL
ncbi:hypothetical protein KY290_018272 [Solanum tuberosum]|uniref:Zinc finger PMZ-type domain-containing protein n=1 Tax=Solanum tuberosum TaxID=4113 RepID=A0ABQ7VDS8_SOLTU|nr:hypothetical protein KY290_018272 [Solanum tuberosum]